YEGFGFPPLEAMASGVAVITSDCSSFPEVAGDSAMMVNPYNSGQLAWSMGEILSDKNLREKMIKKGLACAEKFSWEKCARETLEVFENIK
ncbi:MAG: glycosyltransferase, partial [Patescibacteria group bacterium]